MSARAVPWMIAAAALLGGCSQEYICSYRCAGAELPLGSVRVTAGDEDQARSQCEKERASSCTPSAAGPEAPGEGSTEGSGDGPTDCTCSAAQEAL